MNTRDRPVHGAQQTSLNLGAKKLNPVGSLPRNDETVDPTVYLVIHVLKYLGHKRRHQISLPGEVNYK